MKKKLRSRKNKILRVGKKRRVGRKKNEESEEKNEESERKKIRVGRKRLAILQFSGSYKYTNEPLDKTCAVLTPSPGGRCVAS